MQTALLPPIFARETAVKVEIKRQSYVFQIATGESVALGWLSATSVQYFLLTLIRDNRR